MFDSIKRAAVIAGAVTVVGSGAVLSAGVAQAAPAPINGLFGVDAGSCAGGSATGSYFRMVLPAGSVNSGPFLANGDSTCSDKTITPLSPGSGGGLRSGQYQPQPANSWDAGGNATGGTVTAPLKFYGVGFATATDQVDPQTGQQTATPQIFNDGGTLTGDLSAFGAFWNKQVFNQGAPKPGGGLPGKTAAVHGTYDAQSGQYVIEWASQIVGGPFNNFTGFWHLTGKVSGAAGAPAAPGVAAPTAGAPAAQAKPGVPAQAATAPVAAGVAPQVNNEITVRPVAQTSPLNSPWTAGGVVILVAVASALLTNADRLFRRRSE